MSADLEERLRAYVRTLDDATDERRTSLAQLEGHPTPSGPGWREEPHRRVLLAAAIVVVVALAGTAAGLALRSNSTRVSTVNRPSTTPSTSAPSPSTTAATSTTPPSSSTTVAPSAADDLAEFFGGAAAVDGRLRALAARLNPHITADSTNFTQADVDAAQAIEPEVASLAKTIPPGLPPHLELAVLVVFSELDSRERAMSAGECVRPGPTSRQDGMFGCFANGAAAAARFPSDLAAAEQLARQTAPITAPAPSSRSVAEVLLQVYDIEEYNGGCASHGGYIADRIQPVEWFAAPQGTGSGEAMGRVTTGDGSALFYARYDPTTGWDVRELVC